MSNVKHNHWIQPIILVVLMLMISTTSIILYDHYRYQRIATVDVQVVLKSMFDQLNVRYKNRDPQLMIQQSKLMAQKLTAIVNRLENERKLIILNKPAVVGGQSIDLTNEVQKQLEVLP